jgi:GntR family transcriptional regulator/MocR family aminotransferase
MTVPRTTSPAELLLTLRRDDPTAMHQQLERELRAAIRSGRLAPEAALPATRTLASQLGLSRGVVVEAYEQLVAEGYLTSRHGGGTWVAPRGIEPERAPDARPAPASVPRIDFSYGHPDVTQFPRAAWLRSLRRVLNEAPSARLSYLDARGAPELRVALAAYLNRVRGTEASADRIVICNGFAQALSLAVEVVKGIGGRRVAAEDPGQTDTAAVVRRHGLELAPIRVDEDGLVVEALERSVADAVVVTPAHEFPTGAVMSAERRAALVAWAAASGGVVVEDDYDAEYRYDREPIGAVQGLAPEHVLYAGSASKTLAPGLRLGWLICPTRLVGSIADAKEASDRGSPGLEQLAFADFLERGEFDRHLRHMRPIYRRRRDALLDGLRRDLPALRPVGASAGLHVAAWLPAGIDEAALVARAAGLGVRLSGLTRYHVDAQGIGGGLLFGYGGLNEAEIAEGVRLVAQALADV